MSSTLTALQRAAQRHPTTTRSEALNRARNGGPPAAHVGNERYFNLAMAAERLGLDEALTLAADRRSVLNWPNSVTAFNAVIMLITALGRLNLTPDEVDILESTWNRADLYRKLETLPQRSPLGTRLLQLSEDAGMLGTQPTRTRVITHEQLRRLFETAALTTAVIHMEMEEGPAEVVTDFMRGHVRDLLRDPAAVLRTLEATIESCQQTPPQEGRTAELFR